MSNPMPPGETTPLSASVAADAADREPVAPMDVGHGQRVLHDARQAGDVGDLFEGLVGDQVREQLLGREDQAGHVHAGLVAGGDQPAVLVEPLELVKPRAAAGRPGAAEPVALSS